EIPVGAWEVRFSSLNGRAASQICSVDSRTWCSWELFEMSQSAKATQIRLMDFRSPQMRAFHMSWFAFFLCFFAWFGIAPLMKEVREEMSLTKDQIGWCIIGSVAITDPIM